MDLYNINTTLAEERLKGESPIEDDNLVERAESAASTETDGVKSEGTPIEEVLSEGDEHVDEEVHENVVDAEKETCEIPNANETHASKEQKNLEPTTSSGGSKKKIASFFGVSNFSDSTKLTKFFGVQNFTEEFYVSASTHYSRISSDKAGFVRKLTELSTKALSAIFIAILLFISIIAEVFIKVLPARFEPYIRRFIPKPENEHSE